MQRTLTVALLLTVGSAAQDIPPAGNPTFQSRVDLVLVPVVVRDSSGHVVAGLTAQDFQLFDKGKKQTISSFLVIERAADPAASIPGSTRPESPSAPKQGAAPRFAQRHIVYLFDDLNTSFADLTRVREAAVRHFKNESPNPDRVAISTLSGKTTLAFTADETKLEETVANIKLQPRLGHGPTRECPDVSYYLADLIINRGDERALQAVTAQTVECAHVDGFLAKQLAQSAARKELFVGEEDTRVALAAIKNAIHLLEHMPGQRSIVMASPGFYATTPEAITALGVVLDLAARSNVVISALDVRGLDTTGLADASRRSDMGSVERQYYQESSRASGDVMTDLAAGSGGTFFHNNNDLNAGFTRLAAIPEVSYLIGFSPTTLKANGIFHQIKIQLPNRRDVSIQARHGYYAMKPATEQEIATAEIHEAVLSREEIRDIPTNVRMQLSKSQTGGQKLTVLVNPDISSLHFRKAEGRNRDSLSVITALFNHDGSYLSGARKTVNLALRDATLAQAGSSISIPSSFDVKTGAFMVRVVVREAGQSGMFAYSGWISVP